MAGASGAPSLKHESINGAACVKHESINGNLLVRAVADTTEMDWAPSPSGTVWRKRVHLVGPPESGQVTSVVRYEPRSKFPAHDHPEGEEILVLEGVFSDEHGDWPAGTHLLNPEGFRHAPFSEPGCRLFVKLRQFPGRERCHAVTDTHALDWQPGATPGVVHKPIYRQDGFSDVVRLERWDAGTERGAVRWAQGAELFVLGGELADEEGVYGEGSWLRLPVGATHRPRTNRGCTLYLKTGGLSYLRSDAGSTEPDDPQEAQRERALQAWELVVLEAAAPRVLAALRKVLRVKRTERAALEASLPGRVRRGARVDLEPLRAALAEAGVRCQVRRAGPRTGTARRA